MCASWRESSVVLKISGLRAPGSPGRAGYAASGLSPTARPAETRSSRGIAPHLGGKTVPDKSCTEVRPRLRESHRDRHRIAAPQLQAPHVTGSGGGGGQALAHLKHPARDVDGHLGEPRAEPRNMSTHGGWPVVWGHTVRTVSAGPWAATHPQNFTKTVLTGGVASPEKILPCLKPRSP